MKYYDQLDVIPVFMSSTLVFNILGGIFILNEYSLYNRNQLIGIFISILICMAGISLLLIKNDDMMKIKEMTKDDDESDASNEAQEYRQLLLRYLANESAKTL